MSPSRRKAMLPALHCHGFSAFADERSKFKDGCLLVSVCKFRLVRCPSNKEFACPLKRCTDVCFFHVCKSEIEPLIHNAPCCCSYQKALYSATVHAQAIRFLISNSSIPQTQTVPEPCASKGRRGFLTMMLLLLLLKSLCKSRSASDFLHSSSRAIALTGLTCLAELPLLGRQVRHLAAC